MQREERLRRLQDDIRTLPPEQRLPYIKGWLANHPDPAIQAEITAFLGLLQIAGLTMFAPADVPREQVVVLLHGIRTEGAWQNRVAQELRKLGMTVFPLKYGWMDAVRFLSPAFLGLRRAPGERILRNLRGIKADYPNADLVVVAHSFSTYLISMILKDHTDVRFEKLLLCGSIIPLNYEWDRVKTGPTGMSIVNEVGTRDYWPVLARVGSWGYGPSGAMGFGTYLVRDRFFDHGHSDFFSPEHVSKFWISFIKDGVIEESPWDALRPKQPWFLGLASGIPVPKLSLPLLLAAAYGAIYGAWLICGAAGHWLFARVSILF